MTEAQWLMERLKECGAQVRLRDDGSFLVSFPMQKKSSPRRWDAYREQTKNIRHHYTPKKQLSKAQKEIVKNILGSFLLVVFMALVTLMFLILGGN